MSTSRDTLGSAAFTAVAINRDSLEPKPAAFEGQRIHSNVCADGAPSDEFSLSRGHPVHPAHLPSRSVSISIGDIDAGASVSNHRHAYETLVYVLAGRGHSVIEGEHFPWAAGDAIYVAPWEWHQHFAHPEQPVRYLAATNLPMLHAMGQTVIRQEERS